MNENQINLQNNGPKQKKSKNELNPKNWTVYK